jgi:CubicO group peptidase (beta-lactamase class C family)
MIIGVCLLALCTATAPRQDGAALGTVREFVEAERVRQGIPGLSMALVVEDQLAWSQGFGHADLESGALATGSTRYRIGSVSKPVVGTALMQLVEAGQVDLDADIRQYVPQWPAKHAKITVRHLLTHTSGIRHYNGGEFLSAERYTDLAAPLAVFMEDELLFEPGTQFSYSTYGFNLVANVVESASGLSIAEYMRTRIFEPAWMNDTGLEDLGTVQRGRARWYESADGLVRNAPYVDLSNKYAGGGLTSTVEDLARLHIAYARGKLLAPETIAAMYTNHVMPDGEQHVYGLAWRVRTVELPDGTQAREVSHSGGSIGASTLFQRYPERGLAIAVVANHRADLGTLTRGVLERVLAP